MGEQREVVTGNHRQEQGCQIGPDFPPNLATLAKLGLPDWAGNQGLQLGPENGKQGILEYTGPLDKKEFYQLPPSLGCQIGPDFPPNLATLAAANCS